MTFHKSIVVSAVLILGISILFSCRKQRSYQMSERQQQEMQASFDTLQATFDRLVSMVESSGDTLPPELRNLYVRMQDMHQQMEGAYTEMMGMHGRHMGGRGGMMGDMERHRWGHMTGEWYQQMMAMHEQIADFHNRLGQDSLDRLNRELSHRYGNMMNRIPGIDEPPQVSRDEGAEAMGQSGETLYSQHCASCHGGDAGGLSGAFPPLVDSNWITGDPEVPVRILLHGLTGEIQVNGQVYRGTMPSFRARLTDGEIAAILSYLRSKSGASTSGISADEVAEIRREYENRSRPWRANELRED